MIQTGIFLQFVTNKILETLTKQRFLGFFAVLILSFSILLIGCGNNPHQGKKIIQLSTWGSAQEIRVLQGLLDEFEFRYPDVHVDLLHIPQNYYQKLHILVAGGLVPDVIFTNSISFPVYSMANVFQDLDPFIEESKFIDRAMFYDNALATFTWRNAAGQPSLRAIPRDISNLVIYYNKDLFDHHGIRHPEPAWNWNNFLKTAQDLTIDEDGDGKPEQFGVSFYEKPSLYWMPFVWSAGGQMFSDDYKKFTLKESRAMRGLRYYSDLRNKYHVAPLKTESGNQSMIQMFLQKKLGMMVGGRWNVPLLRDQADFNWDIAPFPVGTSGFSKVGIDASGYAMSATTKYPKESFDLIEFLTSASAIGSFTQSGLIVPARKDVAESDVFLDDRKDPKSAQVFLDVIEFGVPTRTPPRWNEISESVNNNLQSVWNNHITPGDAVTELSPEIDHILEVGQ